MRVFHLKYSQEDPRILLSNGEKAVWLEKYIGKFNHSSEANHDISHMQRWVIKKKTLMSVLNDNEKLSINEIFYFESRNE